jgi:diacylglycerol kinase (ATP)
MRILVLQNATSGSPGRRKRARRLVERLEREGVVVEVESPPSAEAMRARAREARRPEHERILVAGGDGTLHVVVNGLVETPKPERPLLSVLPLGRGNDFAAELGIRSEEDAVRALLYGTRREIDLGRTASGVFLGIAGTGFDARAARRAQETPLLAGSALYTYAVLRTLLDFEPLPARVVHDAGTFEGRITFAAVGNTSRYGGGMFITPKARLDDGLLDLCLVSEISRTTLLRMFPRVFSGSHLSHPRVSYFQSRFVEITTDPPAEVFADGELLQKTPVRIEVLPRELEVLTPGSRPAELG